MDNKKDIKKRQLTELQKRLLEMLRWFHEFCTDNGLRYYIVEGTVLGAVRHNGFIPWDDDIDVGMPRSDYDRLIKIFSHRRGNYILESPYSSTDNYIYPWCKLFDITTTRIEKMRREYCFGIYIDIFPLDGLGSTIEESRRNYKRIDFLNMLWATRVCAIRKGRGIKKNTAIVMSRCIPRLFINEKKLIQRIDRCCKLKDYDSESFVSCTLSTYRSKEIMQREIYGTPTKYVFEDIIVYGPEKFEEYLSNIYGDWQKLPPKEKQVSQHDYIYLDLNNSYLRKEQGYESINS